MFVPASPHIPSLDGVRGVAILLVMFGHFTVMQPATHAEHFWFSIASAGWIGVELFFVLSGMLITGILLDAKQHQSGLAGFYKRRVLRIFPLYFALLVFSFYVLPLLPHPKLENFARIEGNEIFYWLFLQNFSMAMEGGPRHAIMDVTWSLAIEEQFYLLWPLLVFATNLRRLAVIAGGLIAASLLLRIVLLWSGITPWTIYVLTPTRLDGLCAGALVAVSLRWPGLQREVLARQGRRLGCLGLGATAIIATLSGGLPWDGVLVQTLGFTTLAIAFAGLVLHAAVQDAARSGLVKLLSTRFLTAFGLVAYGLYLIHLPLRALLRDTILSPERFGAFPGGVLVGQMIFYLLAGLLCFGVAQIIFRLYERPFLRMGRRPRASALQQAA